MSLQQNFPYQHLPIELQEEVLLNLDLHELYRIGSLKQLPCFTWLISSEAHKKSFQFWKRKAAHDYAPGWLEDNFERCRSPSQVASPAFCCYLKYVATFTDDALPGINLYRDGRANGKLGSAGFTVCSRRTFGPMTGSFEVQSVRLPPITPNNSLRIR